MRRFRKVHMMVTLVALMAALSALMTGPVSADVTCGAAQAAPGTTDDNITVAAGVCTIGAGHIVNGNVIITDGASLIVRGTINGNTEASGSGFTFFDAGSTINGNAIHEGSGTIFAGCSVGIGTITIAGNIEQKGTGAAGVNFSEGGDCLAPIVVTGNIINESPSGSIKLFSGSVWTIDGNVEQKGGGPNTALSFDLGSITVDGSVCGGPPGGYGPGGGVSTASGVTVNGDVKMSC